jgi:hypothetical protein
LPFGEGEDIDRSGGVNVHVEPGQEFSGLPVHLTVVNIPSKTQRFPTDEDILSHREMGHEVQFLVDDADAGSLGLLSIVENNRFPLVIQGALIGTINPAENLHQRGFPRTVFPHEGMNFAPPQLKVYPIKRQNPGEPFGDIFYSQKLLAHRPVLLNPAFGSMITGLKKQSQRSSRFSDLWESEVGEIRYLRESEPFGFP